MSFKRRFLCCMKISEEYFTYILKLKNFKIKNDFDMSCFSVEKKNIYILIIHPNQKLVKHCTVQCIDVYNFGKYN